MTENHFFSLSCMLYPHVRATPDWTQGFDRAWPQNLYLNPASPLIPHIKFPPGFDIETTPLVTFRRIDLLFETSQLDALYRTLHPNSTHARAQPNESIFSSEAVWNLAPAEYVKTFTAPRPHGNYATMVVSTGGHWTTTLFSGLRDPELFHDGIFNVVDFFGEAMDAWAREVQALLLKAEDAERKRRAMQGARAARERRAPRQVVVRAYLPGHEDCHNHRAPIEEYEKGPNGWYNWNQIGDYNRAFEVRGLLSVTFTSADESLTSPTFCFRTASMSCRLCFRAHVHPRAHVRAFAWPLTNACRPSSSRASTRTSTSSRSTATRSSGPTHMRRVTVYIS